MRVMIMHRTNAAWEAGERPTPALVERVGAMIGDLQRAGVMRAGEGLGPSARGARVRLPDGAVTPGPFSGDGALPARAAMFRAATLDEATALGARFGAIVGCAVVDVRPVNEPWDLGFAPEPAGLTTRRYMAVVHADAASESGAPLTAAQRAALAAFTADLERAAAFLSIEHLEPSARGKRLRRAAAAPLVVDGPFTETKELLGGFVLIEVPSIADAVPWAARYLDAVGGDEVELRGLAAGTDPGV